MVNQTLRFTMDTTTFETPDEKNNNAFGLPFSEEILVAIICGVTLFLATIAIAICCVYCWNPKKKPRKKYQQRQGQRPSQGQVLTVSPQGYNNQGFVVISQTHGPGAPPQTVVMGPRGPQQGPPPQIIVHGPPQNQNGTQQRQQQRNAAQNRGPPQQNPKAKTLPVSPAPKMYAPTALTKRHSVKDNKYIGIHVPPPEQDDKYSRDVQKIDGRLEKMAEYISRAIAKTLDAITIDADRITRKDVLGSGQFGVVYKGELRSNDKSAPTSVALKTIAGDAGDDKDLQEFIEEVMRMKTFSHKNVMPMLGMSIMEDKPYMVMPFMDNGDLKTYISSRDRVFTVEDLLRMGLQIAQGMEYLEAQKIIHADLAARNCMVGKDESIKVADFGLSRHLFHSDYYSLGNSDALRPVRWMAPECIFDQKFTSKSDVWSFGILLWEVMTRGNKPYSNLKSNDEVVEQLRVGYRMPCPMYTADEIYEIMGRCWDQIPEGRPSFKDLADMIQLLMEQAGGDYEKPLDNTLRKNSNTHM